MKDEKLCYEWFKPFDSIFVSAKSNQWGRGSDTPQTFLITDYYFDLNNLFRLHDVENAYELALMEAKTSKWGVIDFKI